jgi:hypothetical protein
MYCKEFYLDDVKAITAVPVEDYDFWPYVSPLQPTIAADNLSLPLSNAIVIGQQPATSNGYLVPIISMTGKAEDSEDDSTARRKHTVTVKCEVDDRDGDTWPMLRTLENTPSHLLLTFRGKKQAFVAATKDTYKFSVSRSGGKTSVQFRIESLSGLQLIV